MKMAISAVHLVALVSLAALALRWPPAALAFLLVVPLNLIGLASVFRGVSARAVFVVTATAGTAALAGLTPIWPAAELCKVT